MAMRTTPLLNISIDELSPISALADIELFERIPIEERLTVSSIYGLIAKAAEQRPDANAITFLPLGLVSDNPVHLTNGALLECVTQAANLFHSLGVAANDGVAILLPNLPESYIAMWGASTCGIAVPVNPLLSQAHLAEILRAARVRVVVTVGPSSDPALWAKVEGLSSLVDSLQTVLVVGEVPNGVRSFTDLNDFPANRLVSGRIPNLDDIASCFHTGGTTAAPKLVSHTHRQHLITAVQGLLGSDMRSGDVVLSALPTFHVIAGIATGMIAIAGGATLLMPGANGFRNPYLLMDFWKIIERYRVTSFTSVPTVIGILLDIPITSDISSLKYVSCGAAPLPAELIRAFEAKTGAPIIESYGMTEATTMVASNPRAGTRHPGSVGFPAPYLRVRIALIDLDGSYLADSQPGEEGAVFLQGPNVVGGYVGDALATSAIPEWFPTGDLGRVDGDGHLWLSGRSKDLIIRSGHNIDPRLIEEALHMHPAVAAAAAVGRPDAYAGEVPIAFVTLRAGQTVTTDELWAFAREHVSERPAAPAEVIILSEMPTTALGKVYKPDLRELAQSRSTSSEAFKWSAPANITPSH